MVLDSYFSTKKLDCIDATPPPTPPVTPSEILGATGIKIVEGSDDTEVNWVTIEEVLIFPMCENEDDKSACFDELMQKHIRKKNRYPEMAQEMGVEGSVNTQFIINKDGDLDAIRKRGPHALLEQEAARILCKLPK